MANYLLELIERMNVTSDQEMETGYDSSKTISWNARREAEKLDNEEYIPELIAFIKIEKNKKKRDRANFILGHLAINTNNDMPTQFLIYRTEIESDKYIISSLLKLIAILNKKKGVDLYPLIKATKNDKWLIRHSAIQALNNSKDKIAEKTLIDVLETSKDHNDIAYANATLNKTGTLAAVPYLEKHLNSKKRDVKMSAKFAIDEIQKRNV